MPVDRPGRDLEEPRDPINRKLVGPISNGLDGHPDPGPGPGAPGIGELVGSGGPLIRRSNLVLDEGP